MGAYHFERALFVVGEPNSGKSNQLRSMFRDLRLGTHGDIPTERNLPEFYRGRNLTALNAEHFKKVVVESLRLALFVVGVFPILRELRGPVPDLIPRKANLALHAAEAGVI